MKVAYAYTTHAFELHTTVEPCTDVILLDLRTGWGSKRPDAAVVRELLQDSNLWNADVELGMAVKDLHAFLSASRIPLIVKTAFRDGHLLIPELNTPPPQLQRVNACMDRMKALLQNKAKLVATVKSATTYLKPTVRTMLMQTSESGELEMVPLLQILASANAESIMEAQTFLVERSQFLAHRSRTLDLEWEVESGCRVSIATDIPNYETRDQIADILHGMNLAMFKLMNSGASAFESASLSNAVVEVVRPVVDMLKERHALDYPPCNLKVLARWGAC